MRFELQDTVEIGSGSFDVTVKVGASVTFALIKKTVYVRNADGTEHRLRVVKKVLKPLGSGSISSILPCEGQDTGSPSRSSSSSP